MPAQSDLVFTSHSRKKYKQNARAARILRLHVAVRTRRTDELTATDASEDACGSFLSEVWAKNRNKQTPAQRNMLLILDEYAERVNLKMFH